MTKNSNFIALDLDGTLLTNKKNIPDSTLNLLHKIFYKKNQIAIITSRNLKDTFEVIYPLYSKINNSMYIVYDEGRNILFPNGQTLQTECLTIEDINLIISTIKMKLSHCTIFTDKGLYELALSNWKYIYLSLKKLILGQKFILFKYQEIEKLIPMNIWKIRLNYSQKKSFKLYQYCKNKMQNLYITNNEQKIEIMHETSGKLGALKKICEHISFPLKKVIFIGDEGNDIFCMEQTNSFAMENAPDWVKKHAKHITTDNDHKGVELVLQKFI